MKTIAITGSSGNLGTKLTSFLELIVDTLGMINTSSKPNFLSLLSIINLLPKNVKI